MHFSNLIGSVNLEERVESLEKRLRKVEVLAAKGSVAIKSGKSDDVEAFVVAKIDEIDTQDLVIIALKLKPKQKKSEVKAMLQEWGAKVGNWFKDGNLNTRMVNNGIIMKEKLEDKKSVIFSLTKKGENLALKLIDDIKSGAYWQ